MAPDILSFNFTVDTGPALDMLRRVGAKGPGVLFEGIVQEAKGIFDRSQAIVPVDTGALKRSGKLNKHLSSTTMEVQITYGGPSTPRDVNYARFVHERLDVYHKPPTQAKFLEQPAVEAMNGMEDRLAAYVRARLR